ncbi:MAG TPA: sensor domain-containing diguanylate cyclase, partial [Albitalea sp.]|nr:sensor domain-containing diguanylate cyclase [Albitalea sp.]
QLAARKAISLAEQQRDGAVHAQAWFAFYYLHDRSTLPIALADFKAMLRLLERHRLRNSLQYCLRNYYLHLRFSDEVSVSEVLRVNRQAIRLARASGHLPALAATFQTRGIIHSYRQEYAAMFRNFRISETLRTEVAEPLDLVRIRNGIGYFHTLLEQYGPAMDYYLRAFAVIRQVRDYSEILVSLFNIAWLYLVARQYRPAIELADKILAICRARRLTHFPFRNLFDVYTLKGFCHVSTGELAQARQCLERMRELPFQPSSSGEFLRVLLRGKLAMAQGDYAQAQAEFDSAPSQLNGQTTSGSDDRMLPQCELELAQLKCHQGDTAAAIDHLNRARALCETRAMPLSLRRVQDAIRQLAQHGGLLVEPPPEPLPACELALDDLVAMAQLQTRLDEARKRLREVNLLSRVQRMVDQHDSMERLAEVALRFVAANLSARAASLLRQVDGAWVPLARFGDATDAAALAQVLPRLQQTGTMLIENRLHREGEIGTRASYRSLVGLPMLEEGRVTGALLLSTHDSGRYFDRHDREVLGLLAAQLGSQFAQLAHRERLVRMSTTDTLTGLANRQALQVRLHEDMRAHAGAPVHCALAFVDLDNFKYVNDTFGHAAGDAVLQHFAQLLRRCLRDKDLAARWGGDEFVIFCPGTSAAKARLVADRLLAALDAAQRFAPLLAELCGAPAHFPPDKMLGCSIGIAEALLGPSGVDDQELLRRADSALYRAKALGKGQVEEWKAADDEPVRQ